MSVKIVLTRQPTFLVVNADACCQRGQRCQWWHRARRTFPFECLSAGRVSGEPARADLRLPILDISVLLCSTSRADLFAVSVCNARVPGDRDSGGEQRHISSERYPRRLRASVLVNTSLPDARPAHLAGLGFRYAAPVACPGHGCTHLLRRAGPSRSSIRRWRF